MSALAVAFVAGQDGKAPAGCAWRDVIDSQVPRLERILGKQSKTERTGVLIPAETEPAE